MPQLIEAATDPRVETTPAFGDSDAEHYIWAYTPGAEVSDYCEYHATGHVQEPLEGHIGFVTDAHVHYNDPGDPENGPRLDVWVNLIAYVPAYGRCVATSPDEWRTPVFN